VTEDSIPGLKIPSFGVHGRSSGETANQWRHSSEARKMLREIPTRWTETCNLIYVLVLLVAAMPHNARLRVVGI